MKSLNCLKIIVKAMSTMKMSNRYPENMKTFSVRLMVPSHSKGKLNKPAKVSERHYNFFLPPWIPIARLE